MVCIAFQFVVGCIALEITVLCKNTSTVFHNTLSVQNRVWLAYVVQIVLCCFVLHLHYNSASQYFAIYAQRKTVCDLRLLFRLSDLNGQIPPPLSQTFHTHDDDCHHDEDDNDTGMMMMMTMMMMTMIMVVVTKGVKLSSSDKTHDLIFDWKQKIS